MGGLGKTTLVQQIYKNGRLKDHFTSQALVTVSQSLKQEELLRELIRQLSPNLPQGIDAMGNHRLKEITKELLQNERYLIVLDDVWKTEDWDQLKVAMPNNSCGSRVIITTRIDDVARYSTKSTEYQGMSYPMKALSDSDSWTLFCKKTFQGEPCPSHLEHICE
ncbi:hypothetical protein L6164_001539 [Bauhinia variegata]|uniref:Uncharacterized protein n=1 Tax=Bauhinia variegata TaxID=167791 RepID=A0ACB9QCS8_BAUVA|nr:hypothetical protein L6164_001539 [Bauhinia variegata]